MSAPTRPQWIEHFDLSALPLVQLREQFARLESGTKRTFAGVHHNKWQRDEYVWSEREGKWSGFVPEPGEEAFWGSELPSDPNVAAATLRTVASELILQGAAVEDFALGEDFARDGAKEPLLRLASGAALKAGAGSNYALAGADYIPAAASQWLLFNAVTGALAASAGAGGALGMAPDGSYLLWASAGNEYSVIRVRIGAGAWQWNPECYPGPGCPLLSKTGNTVATVTAAGLAAFIAPFDPLARVVSAHCVLHSDIRTRDGQFDLPAGTLVIGGIRASRGGPQTAIWALHSDGGARLLACDSTYSNGLCECAKTNHFASDLGQHPDGRLFVLSECDLTVYDPDAPSVFERLAMFPASTAGHPGGNCLRFPKGEVCHWTENFPGEEDLVDDGVTHYNRLVRRVFGRDAAGPSTLWHGTNCADLFLGRFWAIRGEEDGSLYLDWLDNGRWHGFSGMKRDKTAVFWQRLRAAMGCLWVFGYAPSETPGSETAGSETPVCAVADGLTLREAEFPFFVRRATPSAGSLFVAARAAADGIGVANRVVEMVAPGSHICSFWDETDQAFEMSRAAFETLGGDVAKLPAFFAWRAMSGTDGGGKWKAAAVAPESGFWLETVATPTTLRFAARPGGALPYDANIWGRLCFDILGDGSIDTDSGPIIEPTCTNAACAQAAMPEGTKARFVERRVPDGLNPATSVQLTDMSDLNRLFDERDIYPSLWLRVDSEAPRAELSSYTQLTRFSRLVILERAAATLVEAVILVTPENQPVRIDELPALQRRS